MMCRTSISAGAHRRGAYPATLSVPDTSAPEEHSGTPT
jgi:hypothetical protein